MLHLAVGVVYLALKYCKNFAQYDRIKSAQIKNNLIV